ncbi:PstS family phosphate ABC transporter substrate-binding protein [Phycisphaera mikurensis]|uniref:Phosphate-binding protein n=1 Tax=Phycisphaera mikurensis (strain NBRC 102666 / KCTC 22515 / FYK2301M01) TaxID=1142394 RepID=I0IFR5_PHYMF|nr:PstS family phosphate ABC transporter substrate-binding protein [Phycisphaera mikurensis]MBB6440507.1 phosphate transport system substrate-binding protein [Phycisphaera mikurensis]BAM04103.1 putative phosphate ABC transporter substrate binding protein [Phycisphaera mikurensis NBRC 102666]
MTTFPRSPLTRVLPGLALAAGLCVPAAAQTRGTVEIDGSSTVGPITSAVQREFLNEYPGVDVTVNVSGTGGGFKRFTRGETDISNASRPIKGKEIKNAEANGIDFVEVPVAYDGLSIVVNKQNDWATELTVEDLQKIFLAEHQSDVKSWKDVDASYPDVPISMYIPGTDSGTFDYFKEVVAGKEGQIRSDVSPSEDDNQLVRGIEGNRGGIGFFGSSYYFENQDKLRALNIKNKDGDFVGPTPETIEDGTYNPFSRPLFIYVKADSMDKPAVREFVSFYLDVAPDVAEAVGYVRLPAGVYDNARSRIANRVTGSVMSDNHESIVKAYTAE